MFFIKLVLRLWKKLCFFLNSIEADTNPNKKISKAIFGLFVSNNAIEKIE